MKLEPGTAVESVAVGRAPAFCGIVESAEGAGTYIVRDHMKRRWVRTAAELREMGK